MNARIKRTLGILVLLLVSLSLFAQSDPTVYITKTGEKYHMATCRYLSKSKIPILLSEAVARGYTPCGVCRPSTLKASTPVQPAQGSGPYRVDLAGLQSYRQADLGQEVLLALDWDQSDRYARLLAYIYLRD